MTVNASVMWRERYKGDGIQSQWPVPFPFLQPEHVRATLVDPSGSGRALLYNAEYTVKTNAERRGGSLGYLVPANHELVVHLDLPYSQEIDLYNNGILDAEVLEYGLDKLTLLCAQLAERVSRAVMVDIASTETPEALCTSLLQARDMAVSSASEAASSLGVVQQYAANVQQNATAAQTEADRAMGYADKVEADITGLEAHLIAVGDAQATRVGEEGSIQVARAKAEADRAAAVVPAFTDADRGKGLFIGARGPEWAYPRMQFRPGMEVPLAGIKLYPNCVWSDRSLVLFADWPDLKAEYDAGYIMSTTQAYAATFPAYWVLNDAKTGLYLPDVGGLFPRAWRAGTMKYDVGRQAGSYQQDQIQGHRHGIIGLVNYVAPSSPNSTHDDLQKREGGAGYSTLYNHVVGVATDSLYGSARFGTTTHPQSYAKPMAIYLGRYKTEV
ncbi:hypothetical protein [Desulfovibrio cuneatus]|uniref:hypothetical protein n=1 Tax=Desulfovibrio cuneatus TaxID=159728 RepID=UPI000488266B|nr:hypothetical protein [Desulfovibrio cuneatus]